MDISMESEIAGIVACKEIIRLYPDIKIYFVSAYPEETYAKQLADCRFEGYIDKTNFINYIDNYL